MRSHLKRHGHATLTEAVADPADLGWIDGHAHEVVLPLVTTRPAAPSPVVVARPLVTNGTHGQLPGSADAAWLNAKIYTHLERLDEIITEGIPRLLDTLDGDPAYWFIRYRSPHETDHLRLRIRTPTRNMCATSMAAVGDWAQRLRSDGVIGRLVFDTYHPETGRYGHGTAMEAAEQIFVADSRAVSAQLRHLPDTVIHRNALCTVNMIATIQGFFTQTDRAMRWLTSRPAPAAATDRADLDQVVALTTAASTLHELPGWQGTVAEAWQARAEALTAYGKRLPEDADTETVLESLLHMHHNRLVGIDRDREATCRRLARHAALAWTARHERDR